MRLSILAKAIALIEVPHGTLILMSLNLSDGGQVEALLDAVAELKINGQFDQALAEIDRYLDALHASEGGNGQRKSAVWLTTPPSANQLWAFAMSGRIDSTPRDIASLTAEDFMDGTDMHRDYRNVSKVGLIRLDGVDEIICPVEGASLIDAISATRIMHHQPAQAELPVFA